MSIKKIIAIAACAVLLFAIAGCGGNANDQDVGNPDGHDHRHNEHNIDYDAAFAAFEPDTVMISASGIEVSWAELFMYIYGSINMVFSQMGAIPEWDEENQSGLTFGELLVTNAVEEILHERTIGYGARLLGVTLSEEHDETVREYFDSLAEMYGGEETFLELLWEADGCCSRELFEEIVKISILMNVVAVELYGENGEKISDDEFAEFAENGGYIMAKHILLRHSDEDGDAKRDEAEEILSQLRDYSDEDFEAFFDELMFEHSEDTGLEENPYGYLFQAGDMLQEFYDASVALDIGDLSEIVETSFGYHIIYRIPVNYDVTPAAGYAANDMSTLKVVLIAKMFGSVAAGWRSELVPEYSDAFNSIDMAEIFVPLH